MHKKSTKHRLSLQTSFPNCSSLFPRYSYIMPVSALQILQLCKNFCGHPEVQYSQWFSMSRDRGSTRHDSDSLEREVKTGHGNTYRALPNSSFVLDAQKAKPFHWLWREPMAFSQTWVWALHPPRHHVLGLAPERAPASCPCAMT